MTFIIQDFYPLFMHNFFSISFKSQDELLPSLDICRPASIVNLQLFSSPEPVVLLSFSDGKAYKCSSDHQSVCGKLFTYSTSSESLHV